MEESTVSMWHTYFAEGGVGGQGSKISLAFKVELQLPLAKLAVD